MKILAIRRKIIIHSSIAGASLLVFCACLYYNMHQSTEMKKKAEQLKVEAAQIESQAIEIQSKTLDIKKYTAVWRNLDENKKNATGIKMDEVNTMLEATALKYNISSPLIKVTIPETLSDGIFNTSTVTVLFTTATLTFKALSDNSALSFINEFINALPGYAVISSLDIKKEKNYTNNDLIAISSGKGVGMISGNINFFWYAFKNKGTVDSAATPAKAANNKAAN